jgi:hypothetical protein
MPRERGPREQVYDAEIALLVTWIYQRCSQAGIPCVLLFELDGLADEPAEALLCATAHTPPGTSLRLRLIRHLCEQAELDEVVEG